MSHAFRYLLSLSVLDPGIKYIICYSNFMASDAVAERLASFLESLVLSHSSRWELDTAEATAELYCHIFEHNSRSTLVLGRVYMVQGKHALAAHVLSQNCLPEAVFIRAKAMLTLGHLEAAKHIVLSQTDSSSDSSKSFSPRPISAADLNRLANELETYSFNSSNKESNKCSLIDKLIYYCPTDTAHGMRISRLSSS